MEIKIQDIIQSELAIFHNEGLLVYRLIADSIKNKQTVKINFVGIERCSTQFLNAAIGKLYLEFPTKDVDSYVQYDYSDVSGIESKVNEVRANAINHSSYDSLLATVTA